MLKMSCFTANHFPLLSIKTPLFHLVFSSSLMYFSSYIYPTRCLDLPEFLNLLLLKRKNRDHPSTLQLFIADILAYCSQDC